MQTQPAEITEALCAKWWVAMGDIFGKPWYTHNGPEPTGAWLSSLREMRLERAMAVLQHFRVSGDAFPPNLSVVMKVAREMKLDTARQLPAQLPPPDRQASPNTVEKSIRDARRASGYIKRSVLKRGEALGDYQKALAESGMSKAEFDAQRLIENGWTPAKEEQFRRHAHVVRFRLP